MSDRGCGGISWCDAHRSGPQTYPARPVRLVVGFAPGGSTDISARLIGQWLSERLGQPFVIENRPGAGGNVATETVARAAPDGYTLLQVVPANTINAALYEKLNFDFVRDIAPVASISREPNVMEVHPSLPVKTIPEFIAYAKSNPGKINIASAGAGSSGHLAGELFKLMTGIDMVHVPYRGGAPALTDLLGGRVQAMITAMASSIEHIRAGRLRALGRDHGRALRSLAGRPRGGRVCPGLRSECLDRHRSAAGNACGDRQYAQRCGQRGPGRTEGEGADIGAGSIGIRRLSGRFRQVHR